MLLSLIFGKPYWVLQQEWTSRQFAEYVAFYRLYPYGEGRADLRTGILASTIAQCHGSKNAKVSDFMPEFDKKPQTGKDFHNMMMQIAQASGKLKK